MKENKTEDPERIIVDKLKERFLTYTEFYKELVPNEMSHGTFSKYYKSLLENGRIEKGKIKNKDLLYLKEDELSFKREKEKLERRPIPKKLIDCLLKEMDRLYTNLGHLWIFPLRGIPDLSFPREKVVEIKNYVKLKKDILSEIDEYHEAVGEFAKKKTIFISTIFNLIDQQLIKRDLRKIIGAEEVRKVIREKTLRVICLEASEKDILLLSGEEFYEALSPDFFKVGDEAYEAHANAVNQKIEEIRKVDLEEGKEIEPSLVSFLLLQPSEKIKFETEKMLVEIWNSEPIKQLVIFLKSTKNQMERKIANIEAEIEQAIGKPLLSS